ncbi:filament integrity protein FraC [Mastigocladopsis repens]|uniref:filament integrity protein FraC n=1 Tax=Mastigocladopsis repens TaxID=221287 RepID=UPI00030EA37D|nr:filament integrity protein FraC [Mastigocladopsis repens]
MFEIPELPLPRVFPIGAILFNFLFLLVAIPIEAYVLHTRLKFDKKTSAFYAISINLFSNVIGWITFFFIQPTLPVQINSELINFIFFNRLQSPNIQTLVIFTAFIIFFGTFLVKYLLLKILLLSLVDLGKAAPEPESQAVTRRNSRRASRSKWQNTNVVTTILIANALSYSLIAVLLFIRSVNT